MSHAMFIPVLTITMVAAGFGLGLAYFATLRRAVVIFASGRGWLGPLGLTLGRIGAAALFFAAAAKLGAAALIAGLCGLLLARTFAVRPANRSD
jgi:N-ATPase, AtpR subunit